MRKKVFKFFFPIPTIIITAIILVAFSGMCYAETPDNIVYALAIALAMTLVFYVVIMIPLDVIIYIIWKLVNKKTKNKPQTQSLNSMSTQKPRRKCLYCGLVQDPDNTFCLSCGKRLKQLPVEETGKKVTHQNNDESGYEIKNNKNVSQEEIKHTSHTKRKEIILNPPRESIRSISQFIQVFYNNYGISITISKGVILEDYVIYQVVPILGTRVNSVLRLKKKLSSTLKTDLEIELRSKLGCIEIIIPKIYFFNISANISNYAQINAIYESQQKIDDNNLIEKNTTEEQENNTGNPCQELGESIAAFISEYIEHKVIFHNIKIKGNTLVLYYFCLKKISISDLNTLKSFLAHATKKKIKISLNNKVLIVHVSLT